MDLRHGFCSDNKSLLGIGKSIFMKWGIKYGMPGYIYIVTSYCVSINEILGIVGIVIIKHNRNYKKYILRKLI